MARNALMSGGRVGVGDDQVGEVALLRGTELIVQLDQPGGVDGAARSAWCGGRPASVRNSISRTATTVSSIGSPGG